MTDDLAELRRARGIVKALTKQDAVDCRDCGETIDLAGVTDELAVLKLLEDHKETHDD